MRPPLAVRTGPGSRFDRRDQEPASARPGINGNVPPKTPHTLAKHDEGARRLRARLVVIGQIVDRVVVTRDAEGGHATAGESHGDNSWFSEEHRRLMDVMMVDCNGARVLEGDLGIACDAT